MWPRRLLKGLDFYYSSQLRPTLGCIYTMKVAIRDVKKVWVLTLGGFLFLATSVLTSTQLNTPSHSGDDQGRRCSPVWATEQMGGMTPPIPTCTHISTSISSTAVGRHWSKYWRGNFQSSQTHEVNNTGRFQPERFYSHNNKRWLLNYGQIKGPEFEKRSFYSSFSTPQNTLYVSVWQTDLTCPF